MTSTEKFSAGASMAGYLYQCRYALLQGLRFAKKKPNGHISVEKFDDVAFENENIVECMTQAKHHIKPGELTDSSEDVWKTIRVWTAATANDPQFPINTKLALITTSVAPEGSHISALRPGTTEEQRNTALDGLCKIAANSKSASTETARKAFLGLTPAARKSLVSAVDVFDRSPNLTNMMSDIESELYYTSVDHLNVVIEMVEGWWFSMIAASLLSTNNDSIPVQSIVRKISEITGYLQRKELPIFDDGEDAVPADGATEEVRIYVRQMRAIQLKDSMVTRGIRDFYRARAQRSRWARENLLLDGESTRYDKTLSDRWARKFDEVCLQQTDSSDAEKVTCGRAVFFWAQDQNIPFRNIVESWISAGSFHGLSDRLELGWHPDFASMFRKSGAKE